MRARQQLETTTSRFLRVGGGVWSRARGIESHLPIT